MNQTAWIFLNATDASGVGQVIDGNVPVRSKQLQTAISRWENEGGAHDNDVPEQPESGKVQTDMDLTNVELVQLQVRVIALENLVIALLADSSDQAPQIALALAAYISPRYGRTSHHLTIRATELMMHMVERSARISDLLKTK